MVLADIEEEIKFTGYKDGFLYGIDIQTCTDRVIGFFACKLFHF